MHCNRLYPADVCKSDIQEWTVRSRGKVFLGLLHSSRSTYGRFTSRGHAGLGGFSTVCPTHNAVEEMKKLYNYSSQDFGQLTLIHGRFCRE